MKSKVRIDTGVRDEVTFLKDCYFTPPYRIANVTNDRKGSSLELVLMSSSPGILDGDETEMEIRLCENSCLHLQTQSYQRLFPMERGASQRMTFRMEKNSSLIYLPHPVVPHQASIYSAVNRIFLTTGCQLIWGEILTCGRKHSDEIFKLNVYQNLTEIFYDDRLTVKENLLLNPSLKSPGAMGQLEQYTHQASLIYWNENKSIDFRIPDLLELLKAEKEIAFGATALPRKGIMIRLLGFHAEQLHSCMKYLAAWLEKDPESVSSAISIPAYAN